MIFFDDDDFDNDDIFFDDIDFVDDDDNMND